MSGPQVYWTFPEFTPGVPAPLPRSLPPPVAERSFRSPFGVDKDLYNFVLKPEIPITFAAVYIISVFALNAYNRKRKNAPWWIANQRFFTWFVVLHNALLTIYSAATFLAMFRAIAHTWPGLNSPTGAAGAIDALCKLHGPRGLGDATTFNSTINIWEVKNTVIELGYDGNPDPSDVGRLWNEGLAFWGWFFYVSKFYEVLDTLIIVAKGKRSPTLQTYHHAGAMICMWAGIRYMSPPIWMFVFVNSFIHALMYTYFTLTAADIRVPVALKRLLTSLQIVQLVWGSSYAAAHLFIQYDIPIATPYQIASVVRSAISSVSSAASAASSTVSQVIESPAASGTLVALAKKLLLRAVGEEGIAERVDIEARHNRPIAAKVEEKIERFNERTHYETKWRTDYTRVNCIDTSGEAFAIYLNLLYLAPLTFLFARFFLKSYVGRGVPRSVSQGSKRIASSADLAYERTSETVEGLGKSGEDLIQKEADIIRKEAQRAKIDVDALREEVRRDVEKFKTGSWNSGRRVSDHVQAFERQAQSSAENLKEKSKRFFSSSSSSRASSPSKRGGLESPTEGSHSRTLESPIEQQEFGDFRDEDGVQHGDSQGEVNSEAPEAPEATGPSAAEEEAITHPQASSQSESQQEENLGSSQATRDGVEMRDDDDEKENEPPVASGRNTKPQETDQSGDLSYSEAVKENLPEGETGEEKQDESLTESQFDTDAMGKSGAIVNYPESKGDDNRDFRERDFGEVDFPALAAGGETEGSDKPIFRPPGTSPS